jgi:hypothetical protein
MRDRKKPSILALILCSVSQLSMTDFSLRDAFGILNSEDYLIAESQIEPSLHSVPGEVPSWETYNRWLCFPMSALNEVECRDHQTDRAWSEFSLEERDGGGFLSVMNVHHEGHHYRFEAPGWKIPGGCIEDIEEMKELLKDQDAFCVFAAEWPSEEALAGEDEESTLWITYGLKTKVGRLMAPIFDPEAAEDGDE